MAARIIDNIHFQIANVHIIYEDSPYYPAVSSGIMIEQLTAKTVDSTGKNATFLDRT